VHEWNFNFQKNKNGKLHQKNLFPTLDKLELKKKVELPLKKKKHLPILLIQTGL
jgi:hypothetical protein